MANDTQVATYSNDPENVPLDELRLRVGDTDCRDAYLTDAEIRFFLVEEPSPLRAAVRGAKAIAAKVAKKMDFKHGSVSKSASQLFEHYNALADALELEASIGGVAPVIIGNTVDEKAAANADTAAVQPDFYKGVHDNPRSGASDPPDNECR